MSDKKFSLDPLSYGTNISAYRMPDPMKYKVGDIVYLVSGGPPMTVENFIEWRDRVYNTLKIKGLI